jgi:tRNA modification GTPase|tara:strand:+ start:6869 stop:8176 length:1308 start_codon:yes stop_codon:yes gene_type:complete
LIFALATPVAQSALAIFRATGGDCLNSFSRVLNRPINGFGKMFLRDIVWEGQIVDRCSVVFYQNPKSFTGEDSVEIFCHGGLPVIRQIASIFLSLGFEEAAPGEFSKRAYENGKLSLNEAEAIADLIHSEDGERARLSSAALSGRLSEMISLLGDDVDSLRVFVEGSIDFSDEDYDFIKEGDVKQRLGDLRLRLQEIIDSSLISSDRLNKNRVLFFGPPNSGKSSLFNRLLGFDRALVSSVPGTTRDLIDSEMFYNSVNLELVDSAGVRETDDFIEAQGIALSNSELGVTDVVLVVLDEATEHLAPKFLVAVGEKKHLLVFNKVDQSVALTGVDCSVSAKTGDGVQNLKDLILALIKRGSHESKKTHLIRDRHLVLFQSALTYLEDCMVKVGEEKDVDVAAEDLRLARSCFDEFLGVKYPDALLGDIFKDFCIGK